MTVRNDGRITAVMIYRGDYVSETKLDLAKEQLWEIRREYWNIAYIRELNKLAVQMVGDWDLGLGYMQYIYLGLQRGSTFPPNTWFSSWFSDWVLLLNP